MDPRKVKRLLDTYREAGVAEVLFDPDLKPTAVRFAAAAPPLPQGEVEGVDQPWTPPAPMGLQVALERIQKQYAKKPEKGRAS